MIIQAYMGCILYESIVHCDVSSPVDFDKTVQFGIYDSGGGRWYRDLEFELQSNGAVCTRSKVGASGSPGMSRMIYME